MIIRITRKRWQQFFLAILLTVSLLITAPSTLNAREADKYTELDETIDLLKEFHLSGVTEKELIQAAIKGIIDGLDDPYTEYFSPQEMKEFFDGLNNIYEGTGLLIDESEGEFIISNVLENSPAAEEGLQEGDVVISYGGEETSGMSLSEMDGVQFGKKGDPVAVTVVRDGKTIELEMEYAEVQVPTVTAKTFGSGIGYLGLRTFTEESAQQFDAKLSELKKQGLKSLILDLRYNGGGMIDSAQKIAGHFINEGTLAYLRDKNGKETELPVIISENKVGSIPVVILVNEWSASASEVLVGAIQDYGAGTVIGNRTYGKGVVQHTYPLYSSGGMLKVTVKEYYTPNKKQVHGKGITPDVQATGDHEQLLSALYFLKPASLRISRSRTRLLINGSEAPGGTVDTVTRNGKIYLPARFLAAAINAELKWDSKLKELRISKAGKSVIYKTDALLNQKGVNYVEAQRFANDFSEFGWDRSNSSSNWIVIIHESISK